MKRIGIDILTLKSELKVALTNYDIPTIQRIRDMGVTVNDIDVTPFLGDTKLPKWDKKEMVRALQFLYKMGLSRNYFVPDKASSHYGESISEYCRGDRYINEFLENYGVGPIYINHVNTAGAPELDSKGRPKRTHIAYETNPIERILDFINSSTRPIMMEYPTIDMRDPKYNHIPDGSFIRSKVLLGRGFTELPEGLRCNVLDISQSNIRTLPNRLYVKGFFTLPRDFPIPKAEILEKYVSWLHEQFLRYV